MSSLRTGFENKIIVGMADWAVSKNPAAILSTYSLGSCVAIAVYDPVAKAGGLVHAMLPDSALDEKKAFQHPGMFVDTGLATLLDGMSNIGAQARRLKVYVAGGAQIMDGSGFFNIGKKNYNAAMIFLQRECLSIEAEHVGGLVNRTVHLSIATGGVSLKVSGHAKDFSLCKS